MLINYLVEQKEIKQYLYKTLYILQSKLIGLKLKWNIIECLIKILHWISQNFYALLVFKLFMVSNLNLSNTY